MPAPERSRSSLFLSAVISVMFRLLNVSDGSNMREGASPEECALRRQSFSSKSPFPVSVRPGAAPLQMKKRASTGSARTGKEISGFDNDLFSGGLVQSAEVDARSLLRAAVALGGGGGDGVAIEADGAAGVIVRRNREGDAVGRDVRIEDRDDRDAQRVGFLDRQFFLVGVDHGHDVGNAGIGR